MRLPASKVIKEGGNIVTYVQKKGVLCLPCSLRDGGRPCQRAFIFTPSFVFHFGHWVGSLESTHVGWTRGVWRGKKHSPAGGAGHVMAGAPWLSAQCHMWNPPPQVNAHVSLAQQFLPRPTDCNLSGVLFTQGQDQFCLLIHLKVKGQFAALRAEPHYSWEGMKDTEQKKEEGGSVKGAPSSSLTVRLERGIFCYYFRLFHFRHTYMVNLYKVLYMFYVISLLPLPFCPEVEQSVILAPLRNSLFRLLIVRKSQPASHLREANFLVRNQIGHIPNFADQCLLQWLNSATVGGDQAETKSKWMNSAGFQ